MSQQLSQILQFIVNIFKFHKKKIFFLFGSIIFCVVILFPYNDLRDFITLQVSQNTQNDVYLQFDKLSFGLIPQLAVQMDKAVIESVYMPTMELEQLAIAPKFSTLFGSAAAKIQALGVLGGQAVLDFSPSNELETDGKEYGIELNLDRVSLKEISKLLKDKMNFPVSLSGSTHLESQLYVDPRFKAQPKGEFKLNIKKLELPSTTVPLGQGMGFPVPTLKLEDVTLVGSLDDGTIVIKEGKIGEPKNDLYGTITGDLVMNMAPGGRALMGGYNLKVNLNISENLKRQLGPALLFVDGYKSIGTKYKFNSLRGIRYSMRLTARKMSEAPDVFSY